MAADAASGKEDVNEEIEKERKPEEEKEEEDGKATSRGFCKKQVRWGERQYLNDQSPGADSERKRKTEVNDFAACESLNSQIGSRCFIHQHNKHKAEPFPVELRMATEAEFLSVRLRRRPL
ncbi:hypothetical protein RUM43_008211 [Polyplax serrata]|uniref:Uncharacterized protein n=1 Tax=Polyplax serrata TaxID=468196 RepID=A0AAN8S8X3_POLSC